MLEQGLFLVYPWRLFGYGVAFSQALRFSRRFEEDIHQALTSMAVIFIFLHIGVMAQGKLGNPIQLAAVVFDTLVFDLIALVLLPTFIAFYVALFSDRIWDDLNRPLIDLAPTILAIYAVVVLGPNIDAWVGELMNLTLRKIR